MDLDGVDKECVCINCGSIVGYFGLKECLFFVMISFSIV